MIILLIGPLKLTVIELLQDSLFENIISKPVYMLTLVLHIKKNIYFNNSEQFPKLGYCLFFVVVLDQSFPTHRNTIWWFWVTGVRTGGQVGLQPLHNPLISVPSGALIKPLFLIKFLLFLRFQFSHYIDIKLRTPVFIVGNSELDYSSSLISSTSVKGYSAVDNYVYFAGGTTFLERVLMGYSTKNVGNTVLDYLLPFGNFRKSKMLREFQKKRMWVQLLFDKILKIHFT